MKRRDFFTQSVSVGTVGMLAPTAFAATSSSAQRLSKAWFETLLDEQFVFHKEGQEPIAARLVAIHIIPGSRKHEQFTAVFRITGGNGQGGLVEAEHAKAGRFPLSVSAGTALRPQQMC